MNMSMKTYAIIGGTAGLGGALARLLADDGHAVWLADEPGAASAAPALPGVAFHPLDLADPAAPRALVKAITRRLGRLDGLVVAASAMAGAPLADWQVDDWDRAAAINLRLPFLAAQAAHGLLVHSGGSLVLVSSTATLRGQVHSHGYQATKAGLAGLLRSLAAELGPQGVRVNLVLPGWVETSLTQAFWQGQADAPAARAAIDGRIPLRRHGRADEVAAAMAWLLSDAASYVTGAIIPLDGGDTAV
ncbi:SDR family oxidoreductase [Sphingobium sp. H39-3-25]|uniref:SDR family NAD(P)-dependent oxidoreductase n=1 Tax=Sphingobium arseniciresistens TaxID=3030834 RepID=UPI0023B9F23E|nr:SDR family oxidoreductase [Sphingobium arseniciresistens]